MIQFLLSCKGYAVKALHLRVAFFAAPVGPGHAHQFKGAHLTGRLNVWAATQIGKLAISVEAHVLDLSVTVGSQTQLIDIQIFSDGRTRTLEVI